MADVKFTDGVAYQIIGGKQVSVKSGQVMLSSQRIGFTECPVDVDNASTGIQLELGDDNADAPGGHLLIYFVLTGGALTAHVTSYDNNCDEVSTHTFTEDQI